MIIYISITKTNYRKRENISKMTSHPITKSELISFSNCLSFLQFDEQNGKK